MPAKCGSSVREKVEMVRSSMVSAAGSPISSDLRIPPRASQSRLSLPRLVTLQTLQSLQVRWPYPAVYASQSALLSVALLPPRSDEARGDLAPGLLSRRVTVEFSPRPLAALGLWPARRSGGTLAALDTLWDGGWYALRPGVLGFAAIELRSLSARSYQRFKELAQARPRPPVLTFG
jgi:hypothetical protein